MVWMGMRWRRISEMVSRSTAAGVIRAVAEQNHRADGQAGGVGQHLFQTVSDMRRGSRRRSA